MLVVADLEQRGHCSYYYSSFTTSKKNCGGNTVKYALNMTTKFIPLQVMYFICYAVIDLFAMECPSHVGQYYITIMCKDG